MSRRPDAARRVEILDAAVDYLTIYGPRDVSIRRVAAHIGLSPSGLVHHFGTKEALVEHALLRASGRLAEIQDRWLQRSPSMTVPELARRWWRWVLADDDHQALAKLAIEISMVGPVAIRPSIRRERLRWWADAVERMLVEQGLPRPVARTEATLLRAAWDGLVIDLAGTGERSRTTAGFERAVASLESTIAAHVEPVADARRP